MQNIDAQKEKSGSRLSNEDIQRINQEVSKIEIILTKTYEQKVKIDTSAVDNKEKMANHELENKINRRQEEITRID